jgi:hypothetical protein
MSFELMPGSSDHPGMPSTLLSSSVDAVVIRRASDADAPALARLAALDSRRPLTGTVLLAERDGRILAAMSLDDERVAADPFAPTDDLVGLLRVRSRAIATRPTAPRRPRSTIARRWPAVARG